MKINRCKSLFCSFKQVLKNIKNCLNNLHKPVIPEGLYRESQPCVSSSRKVSVRDIGRFFIPRTTTLRGDGGGCALRGDGRESTLQGTGGGCTPWGNRQSASGFTLLEVIVAIIIIGALLAFALPKYETALDKSRFSTLMPITKSIKDAEEIFYVASNQYTPDIQSLDVKTNPGETVQISVVDDDDYSYVQAIDPRIDNIYKAYLKHSTNFPEERHCEALSDSSRAKKVCESIGGVEVGENGNYIAYSLDSNGGHGTFEKDCEDAQPDTEQTCASGCGTQTRTVTCNRRTGTWETGDFEGDCPVQGETTQSCTNGVGTETRTFRCEGNTWVANEWDTSSCTCDPETKPTESESCTYGGTKTRNVECDANNLTWKSGTWDESGCECDPDTKPAETVSCSDGCRTGTQTQSVTCEGTTWKTGSLSDCSVTKPTDSSTSCSGTTYGGYTYSGGTKTRSYTCSNGSWTLSSTYDYSACTGGCSIFSKPDTSSDCASISSSYKGGTATRSVTCNNGYWQTGSWSTSDCCTTAEPDPVVVDNCTYYYYCDRGRWYRNNRCELPEW